MSTRYLTVREVVQLHDDECGRTTVDLALLESAVDQPQASAFGEDAYPTLHNKVGALFHSLCENQAFADGTSAAQCSPRTPCTPSMATSWSRTPPRSSISRSE